MGPYPGQPVTHGRRCKQNITVLDVRCSFCAGSLVEQGLAEMVNGRYSCGRSLIRVPDVTSDPSFASFPFQGSPERGG